MNIKTIVVGQYQTNCYIIHDDKNGIVIDPGDDGEKICNIISNLGIDISAIVLTHYHFDHVGAVKYVQKKTCAKLAIGEFDLVNYSNPPEFFNFANVENVPVDILLKDGDIIKYGEINLKVMHTPGHTPGGITLVGDAFAVCGDTIFYESIGRTDFPGCDYVQEILSVRNILQLSDDTILYCGHGKETTVKHEKNHNPYVRIYL